MKVAIQYDPNFEAHVCQGCGTTFAVPAVLLRRFNQNGAALRCTNPTCPWPSFTRTESEVDKLTRQLKEERERAGRAHQAREWAEKQLSDAKGQVTKLKKRVANGVCPCCQRSFQNLRRHMAHMHPEEVGGYAPRPKSEGAARRTVREEGKHTATKARRPRAGRAGTKEKP